MERGPNSLRVPQLFERRLVMRASWQAGMPATNHGVCETLGSENRILVRLQQSDCMNRASLKIRQVVALMSQDYKICQGVLCSVMH